MDRRSIATARRYRQVSGELSEERAREAALRDELEDVVTELEGPALDAAVLEQLSADDAAVAREVVQGGVAIDLGVEDDFFHALEQDDDPYDPTAALEEEVVRLQEAIEASRARQRALQAYLAALGAV